MLKIKPFLLLSLSFLFLNVYCKTIEGNKIMGSPSSANTIEGLKMGFVADSQLQTKKDTKFDALMKGGAEDRIINVSLRVPALNQYSEIMLRYFIESLIDEKKVDMIFYLGDAANNGCKDEINTVFKILSEYRSGRTSYFSGKEIRAVPIFFIIGNHDYLGAGNTPFKKSRIKLCTCRKNDSEKKILESKCDLILRASRFNKESNAIKGWNWEYHDNVTNRQQMISYCNAANRGGQKEAIKGTRITEVRKPNCFLSGSLVNRQKNYKILLMDTSDYYGKWYIDTEKILKMKWFGLTGWISDEQIEFLKGKVKKETPLTILLSHYPHTDLAVNDKIHNKMLIKKVWKTFMGRTPGIGNYWISAHSHNYYSLRRVKEGSGKGEINFDHLNVGSTTDAYYKSSFFDLFKDKSSLEESKIKPPHALAVSIAREPQGKASNLSPEPVFIQRDELYYAIKRVLKKTAKNPDISYTRINNIFRKKNTNKLLMFGFPDKKDLFLELEYKVYNNYVKICRSNLEKFVQYVYENQDVKFPNRSRTGKISKGDIELRLGLYASYKEIKRR